MSCVSVVHLVPMFAPLFVSPFLLLNFLYQVCTFFSNIHREDKEILDVFYMYYPDPLYSSVLEIDSKLLL